MKRGESDGTAVNLKEAQLFGNVYQTRNQIMNDLLLFSKAPFSSGMKSIKFLNHLVGTRALVKHPPPLEAGKSGLAGSAGTPPGGGMCAYEHQLLLNF